MTAELEKILTSFDNFAGENAFCIGDTFYTYAQLKQVISRIQKTVLEAEIEKNSNIGILTYDDIETYASVFAILFSGHAFVPINPLHPIDRNMSIITQAEIKLLLTSQEDLKSKEYASEKFAIVNTGHIQPTHSSPLISKLLSERIAYILFTSGSTGIPKGVPLTVKNLNSFLAAFFAIGYEIDHHDKFIQMFDLTFDLSIMSYMAPLCIGACVYTVPFDAVKYMHVYKLMEQYDLTFTLLVPSVITHLRPYFEEIKLEKMRYSLFCGEALYEDVTMEWTKCLPNARIQNVYGPTEATIFCMTYDINSNDDNKSLNGILSIGKPMKNTEAIVVDDNSHPLGAKEKGELCLTGDQVTLGYWKNESKNKESFFEHNRKKYYRTGDLCFRDEQGDYYYSGRVDFQVKIQGFRVELSEIEHHAREFVKMHAVVAYAHQNSNGVSQIFLFVENFKSDFENLNNYLKEKLPSYMIPSRILNVETFPLNSNGKIDRNKLAQKIF